MMTSVSPKPRVVSTAVFAPENANTAFDDWVVACTIRPAPARSASTSSAERAGRVGETVEDAALEIGGRGERLAHRHAAARAVDGDDVGERSADVDRDGVHGYSITRIVQSSPPWRQMRSPTSSMSDQYCGWMRPMWLTA